MDKKVVNKAKSMLEKNIKITRETDQKIYFIVSSYKGSYNKTMSKAPEWFWKFEEKNDSRWERQEKFNSRQEKINLEIKDSVKDLSSRVDGLSERVDGLSLRLDNIVEKNDLSE